MTGTGIVVFSSPAVLTEAEVRVHPLVRWRCISRPS
jgi:hypothetical protein